jgi:hypothetical protein
VGEGTMPESGADTEDVGKLSQRLSGRLKSVSNLLQEKRRYRRVAVPLVVKMLLEDGTEEEAIVRDISAGGASLLSENRPAKGSRVILYIREVGRMECSVVRDHPHGFAVDFYCSKSRRDKIADKLTWLTNRTRLGLSDEGLALEGARGEEADLVLSTGVTMHCQIVGLSLNGASVQVAPRPSIGAQVILGRMRGTVTHHLPGGVGIEFTGTTASKKSA